MNNTDFDKILKPLRDYDPQVKPDWEAFVVAREGQLNNPDNSAAQSTGSFTSKVAMIKYAAILVTIASGIFFLWNYNSISSTGDAASADAPKTIKAIETPYIPAKAGANTTLPQLRKSEKSLQDNPSAYELELNAENLAEPVNLTPAINAMQLEENVTNENAKPVIVKTSDTVLIKKTIIVRDTIHTQKPQLK